MPHQQKFDIALKALVEQYPEAWTNLAGNSVGSRIEVIDADVSTLTAAADKVIRVEKQKGSWILNLELQSDHQLGLPEKMHFTSTVLKRRHDQPVCSLIVLLRRAANAADLTGELKLHVDEQPYLQFNYRVVKIWECELEELLEGSIGLLPLAPLTDKAKDRLSYVVSRIDERIAGEVSSKEDADRLWETTCILMGLRYDTQTIETLTRGVSTMEIDLRSSSIIQSALAEGRAEGRAEGNAEGIAVGLLEEVRSILLRQGRQKFGEPDTHAIEILHSIADLAKLETLADRILLVSSWDDLLQGVGSST